MNDTDLITIRTADAELLRRFADCALRHWTFTGGDLQGAIARVGAALTPATAPPDPLPPPASPPDSPDDTTDPR
jgi:hypothetical protein